MHSCMESGRSITISAVIYIVRVSLILCVGKSTAADGYEITFVVDEPRRVTGGVTTLFGTNEGSLVSII